MTSEFHSLAIWGDGAVGTGLAVALSFSRDLVLVGPPGSGRGEVAARNVGALSGEASLNKVQSGDGFHTEDCIVAVKAYHLSQVAEVAMRSTRGRCIILCNGMGLEREWGEEAWRDRAEPALLTMGFCRAGNEDIQVSPGSVIVASGGRAEDIFRDSGLPVEVHSNMEPVRWGKWLVNSVINPLGALTGLRNSELLRAGLGGVMKSLEEELTPVIPEDLREKALEIYGGMTRYLLEHSSNRSSMLQDLSNDRPTEIDFLTGLCEKLGPDEFPTARAITALVKARA